MSYISAILIAFFLFYNGIGTTITNPKLVKWARRKNIKIAYSIRSTSRKKFSDINESLYKNFQKITRILFIAGLVLIIPLKNSIIPFIILASAICFAFILIGLTSFKKLKIEVKANFRFGLFLLLGILLLFVLTKITGDTKAFNTLVDTSRLPKQWPAFVLILFVVNILAWFALRILIKGFAKLSILFAKWCYILNPSTPLKPFYLIFQIASVIVSDVVIKIVKHFW